MVMRQLAMTAAALLTGSMAQASSVGMWLEATFNTTNLAAGDMITLDVMMDFSAEPVLAGVFNVNYDPAHLAVTGFTNNNIGTFENRDPELLEGQLYLWAFSDFGGLGGPMTVGTVSFEVVAAAGDGSIGLQDSMLGHLGDIAPTFHSIVTFQPYPPDQIFFEGLDYSIAAPVPLPAGLWLMLSGVGALAGIARHGTAAGWLRTQ